MQLHTATISTSRGYVQVTYLRECKQVIVDAEDGFACAGQLARKRESCQYLPYHTFIVGEPPENSVSPVSKSDEGV